MWGWWRGDGTGEWEGVVVVNPNKLGRKQHNEPHKYSTVHHSVAGLFYQQYISLYQFVVNGSQTP